MGQCPAKSGLWNYNFITIKIALTHTSLQRTFIFRTLVPTSFLYVRFHFGTLIIFYVVSARSLIQQVRISHIAMYECRKPVKFGVYIEESCNFGFVLFVNFCIIHYRDTVEQTTCMFSRLIHNHRLPIH